MCPDPQLGPDGRPPIQPPKLDAESAEVHSHSARHPDPCRLDLGRVDSGHEEASFHLGRGARGRRGHRSTKTTDKTPRPGPTSPSAAPSTPTSAGHVETCGVHFPCPMSDADAFEQAARLDDLGELHARQPGQHITAEPFRVVHGPRVRLLPFCERMHRDDVTGRECWDRSPRGRCRCGLSGLRGMARFGTARRSERDHGRPSGSGPIASS